MKIDLEVSKQQKNTKHANANQGQQIQQNQQRHSRSPDRSRGGNQRGQNNRNQQQQNNNYDRYDNRNDGRYDNRPQSRDQDYRQGPPRGRDGYRPMRSPSPPRGGYRGRDDYPPQRGRDYYDGPNNRRTRSRSPVYDRREPDRYRQRSPTPPRRPVDDASLPIPRRAPEEVPDVQILVMEELDRNFTSWVKTEIEKRGLKVDMIFLSPRLPVELVVKRQILEGVIAVVKLTMPTQNVSKIPLQIFDRSRGANQVRYDDYENLDPNIAAEVVLREKSKIAVALHPQQTRQAAYAQPPMQQYPPQQQFQQPQAAAPAPNLANVVAQLDNETLQKLLGTLSAPMPQQTPTPASVSQQLSAVSPQNGQVDIASILGMLGKANQQPQQAQQQQQPQYVPPPQQQNQNQQNQNAQNAQYAAQQQPTPQPGAQDVQSIMAQLARLRQ